MNRIFKKAGILPVIFLLASCNINATYENREADKEDALSVADSFYNRMEQNDHTGTYVFFTKKFLQVTDTFKLGAFYKKVEATCGQAIRYKLLDWKTSIVKGSNPQSEYYLVFEITRKICKTKETLTFKKEVDAIRITTYDVKTP